jgi:hypothetical protein
LHFEAEETLLMGKRASEAPSLLFLAVLIDRKHGVAGLVVSRLANTGSTVFGDIGIFLGI